MPPKSHELNRVDESVSQLISATTEWLTLDSKTPEQLVLNAARIRELHGLQKILRKQIKSSGPNSEQVWVIVRAITSAVVSFALDVLSNSIKYILRREYWWGVFYYWHSRLKFSQEKRQWASVKALNS